MSLEPQSPKSTLEIKIQQFVSQYGPEQLIEWIDEFDFMGGQVKFSRFKKLEKISCEVFGVTIADMHHRSNTDCTNAKRVISFVAANDINLPPAIIAKLLGNMALRSINYYIKDAEEWTANSKLNKPFFESYTKIIEKFNIQ